MDVSLWILLGLVIVTLIAAFVRDPALPLAGVRAGVRLFGSVWVELALGFILAGLIDVLVSPAHLVRLLGDGQGLRGILVGWAIGLVLPGGPYLLFPMVASLFAKGAGPGPLIALIAAKTLLSPIRMLTYEAPLLGWPLTLARLLPGLLVPPLLGVVGQFLYRVFSSVGQPPR
ncbi:MAG: permease [Deltaproteobacteria bacterium]|nr:permease [Deltaproteobacteria bacterium]